MVSPIPPVHLLTALGSSFFRIGGKVKALSLPDGVGSASGAALRKAWHSPMLGLAGLHPEWRQPVSHRKERKLQSNYSTLLSTYRNVYLNILNWIFFHRY